MSKSVTIPSFNNPFVVEVNNVKYSYPAGTTQTVPDEVACIIDNIIVTQFNALIDSLVASGALTEYVAET